jgi:hypothetical protein
VFQFGHHIISSRRAFVESGRIAASDTFMNQLGEEDGVDDELTPFRIEGRRGFGGHDVVQRSALAFQRRDILADRDQHVAVVGKLCPVADGTWPGMMIVLSRVIARFSSTARIEPSMLPPVE